MARPFAPCLVRDSVIYPHGAAVCPGENPVSDGVGADVEGDRLVPEQRSWVRGSLSDWQDNFCQDRGGEGKHDPASRSGLHVEG